MSESPKKPQEEHDFDWVRARYESAELLQFKWMMAEVEQYTNARNAHGQRGSRESFKFDRKGESEFEVSTIRFGVGISVAVGYLVKDDVIRFVGHEVRPAVKQHGPVVDVKTCLGEDGKLWFLIKGDESGKKYRRWEILRRCLERFFFRPSSGSIRFT